MQPNDILDFFAKYVEAELGIVFHKENYYQLQQRIDEIVKILGVSSAEELYLMGQKGITGNFKQLLLDIATNNETSFFRDPTAFKAIENLVLPDLFEKTKDLKKLRIWSAASSTGQEALSVAMIIHEWMAKNNKRIDFEIIGTDISERALNRAKNASYTQLEVQRGLPMPLLIKYFRKDVNDNWIAKDQIRNETKFQSLNLKAPYPFKDKFDLILCRNVLIYQSVAGKKEIIEKLCSMLHPAGYFALGSTESMIGLSTEFEMKMIGESSIYKKKLPQAVAA